MNDITTLNWRKIHSFQAEREKQAEDRPYTHSEIQALLDKTTDRNRSIILLMCSGGLRIGAIPLLRIKDLEPIDKYNIYKINVYSKSVKSRYYTFCTPEARKWTDQYLAYRKRYGERLTDNSPLFRTTFNPHDAQIQEKIVPITYNAIAILMDTLLKRCGLRTQPLEGQRHHRLAIMKNHGFRKFFETNAFKAGMSHIYIRRLMGQKSDLEDAYLKLSEEELLEGDSKHVGYVGTIDQLTVDESQRLKKKVKELTVENKEFSIYRQKIDSQLNKIVDYLKLDK